MRLVDHHWVKTTKSDSYTVNLNYTGKRKMLLHVLSVCTNLARLLMLSSERWFSLGETGGSESGLRVAAVVSEVGVHGG